MKENKVILQDTLLSDITPLGASLILKEEGKVSYFSREYQSGELYYEDSFFKVDCINFVSGNVQITALYGDKEMLRPFLSALYARQRKRLPFLRIRKFFQYLYILSSLGIGFMTFLCLCTQQFQKFFYGMLLIGAVRLLYTASRNWIR